MTAQRVPDLVSVVIPCFNQHQYVVEAVRSAVAQDYQPVETIVIDDGSRPPIAATLDRFPVELIGQANSGVSGARNRGLAAARGEFIIFLDADDRLLANAAGAGVRRLGQQPEAACAVGLCRVIDAGGQPAPFRQRGPLQGGAYLELLRGNFIWMPGQAVFRRDALGAVAFDSAVDACADYDLYLRLARRHPMEVHDELVAEYRQHAESMSENARLMLRQSLFVLGRQRRHLRDRAMRAAWREGRQFWRGFYGDRVVEEVRAGIRTPGKRQGAAAAAMTLLRYHPLGAVRQLLRKARVMTAGPAPASFGGRRP